MKKIIGSLLMIVLSIYLILMYNNMSEDFDKVSEDVTFTAVSNTSVEEVLYVHEFIHEITDIHIEGIHRNVSEVIVSINALEDGSIILVDNVTGSGDIIEITYLYQVPSSEYTTIFIESIPLIMIVIVIGGIAVIMTKKR